MNTYMDLSCSAVPSETEQNIIVIMLMVMQICNWTDNAASESEKTSYTVARRPVVNNFISLNRAIFLPNQF